MENPILELIGNIDWAELRKQKETLVKIVNCDKYLPPVRDMRNLNGIVHLLDAIQDYATDYLEIPEEKVFGDLNDDHLDLSGSTLYPADLSNVQNKK